MACYKCKYNIEHIWKYGESTSTSNEEIVDVQLLALWFANSAISQSIRVPFSQLDTVLYVVATFCRSFLKAVLLLLTLNSELSPQALTAWPFGLIRSGEKN